MFFVELNVLQSHDQHTLPQWLQGTPANDWFISNFVHAFGAWNRRGNENAEPANVEDKKKMRKEKGKIQQKAYRDRILASKYCDE